MTYEKAVLLRDHLRGVLRITGTVLEVEARGMKTSSSDAVEVEVEVRVGLQSREDRAFAAAVDTWLSIYPDSPLMDLKEPL